MKIANLCTDMPGTGNITFDIIYIDYENCECQVLNFSCMQVHVYTSIVPQRIEELAIDVKNVSFYM